MGGLPVLQEHAPNRVDERGCRRGLYQKLIYKKPFGSSRENVDAGAGKHYKARRGVQRLQIANEREAVFNCWQP